MTPNNITCYRYQPLGVWSTAYPSWSQCGLLDHYQCVPCGSNRNACGTVTWKASPILLTVVQDVVTTAWNDLGHWLRSSQHWQKTRVSPTCKFQGNFFWCRTANKNVTLFKLPYKPIQIFSPQFEPLLITQSSKAYQENRCWTYMDGSENGLSPQNCCFIATMVLNH